MSTTLVLVTGALQTVLKSSRVMISRIAFPWVWPWMESVVKWLCPEQRYLTVICAGAQSCCIIVVRVIKIKQPILVLPWASSAQNNKWSLLTSFSLNICGCYIRCWCPHAITHKLFLSSLMCPKDSLKTNNLGTKWCSLVSNWLAFHCVNIKWSHFQLSKLPCLVLGVSCFNFCWASQLLSWCIPLCCLQLRIVY